ncbi:MAG TPA: PadR family transcriptional regulator [Streptosporangiaceae bacterium]|nr:PadR family transcriptional regulator [Streptosporangiaceae bacterium]
MSSSNDRDNPVAGLSELEVALLALLSIRPMTGYEILRHHARALEPWWETPRTQIYPKLRELQRRGLIEHEYVVQESKPNKRLYSIGPAGSEALASWLGSTINVPEMRHHMMMRLFLGNLLPIEETSRLLIGYRDRMAARAVPAGQGAVLPLAERPVPGQRLLRAAQPGSPDRDDRPGGDRDRQGAGGAAPVRLRRRPGQCRPGQRPPRRHPRRQLARL